MYCVRYRGYWSDTFVEDMEKRLDKMLSIKFELLMDPSPNNATLVNGLIAGGPNAGYSQGGVGSLTPNTLEGETINYFGSFGPDFFNLRTVGDVKIAGYDNVRVTIETLGTVDFSWNGTNLRYQGSWGSGTFRDDMTALVGQPLEISIALF